MTPFSNTLFTIFKKRLIRYFYIRKYGNIEEEAEMNELIKLTFSKGV